MASLMRRQFELRAVNKSQLCEEIEELRSGQKAQLVQRACGRNKVCVFEKHKGQHD